MKQIHIFVFRVAVFLTILFVAPWSLGQVAKQTTSPGTTVAPLGTEKSISVTGAGQLQYIDQRLSQKSVEIDAPAVSFTFEFSQSGPSTGVARAIVASNVRLREPVLHVATDGDLDITLNGDFTRYSREKGAYRSVSPRSAFQLAGVNATTDNTVVLDIPVTLSGDRGVLNIGLQDEDGEGEAASLFLLRDSGQIYVGVQGFSVLEDRVLEQQLQDQGVDAQDIERQLKSRRSRPGDVEIKVVPPPQGHEDSDPFNSITVDGQIQFTDINGATFPVQDADIEVYDIDGAAETLMNSGTTDSTGNYSIIVAGVDTSGDATGPDILVRAYPRGSLVRVHIADGGDVYTMDSPVQNNVADDSTVTIDMTAGNDEATVPGQVAFEVYEAIRYFGAFISSLNGSAPAQILVEYPRTAAGDGSSYTPGSSRLNLSISDGHDWDNMQHEYGHHVQNVLNLGNNPGGGHSSTQNSCVERPTKDEGLRLAWGESWPTVFAIIAQNDQNLAALGIPNLGDTSYTDTKPAGPSTNYNVETGTAGQLGEATERAIMRLFWDTYDNTDDNVDVGVSYSAQSIWDAGTASNPEIISTFWAQFTSLFTEAENMASGGTLTREGFGAGLTNPPDGSDYAGGPAPTFTWNPNLPCDAGGNGRFSVHFQHQGTGALLYAIPFQAAASFTPSDDQLEQIFVAPGGNVIWSVLTRDLTAPQTGDYYGETRAVVDNFDVPDRDPVDIALVLDLSSSMNSTPPDGDLPKIDVLQQAVELFINTWAVHAIDGDRLGLIYFNDNISSIAGTPPTPVLNDVAASAPGYIADVNAQSGSGCTAVGGAMQEAFDNFDIPDRNRFVLLFSDGIQNVNPFVGTDAAGNLQIITYPIDSPDLPFGGFFCNTTTAEGLDGADIVPDGDLLADKDVTIHSIGVGVDGADFEDLIEQVSAETSGEHHFTSLPDAELDIFFTNDLVESLKQNTLQIVKTESGSLYSGQSHLIEVPVGPTATELTLAISWKSTASSTPLSVAVSPPDGAAIPAQSNTLGQGHRVLHYEMPINADGINAEGAGDWEVALTSGAQAELPYQFSAIVDESCFKFDMIRPPGGLQAGDQMPITVKLGGGSGPLLSPDDFTVRVSRPARNRAQLLASWLQGKQEVFKTGHLDASSLTALRAGLSAEEETILPSEKSPFIIHQLEAIAFLDPEFTAAVREQEAFSVQLKAAGDGVYSNLVPRATVPGHYQLEFMIDGASNCGPITRSEKSGFLVRLASIDPESSLVAVTAIDGGDVEISITPTDRFGNILGPGFSDQIEILYGSSQVNSAVIDKLDGSYLQRFSDVSGKPGIVAIIRGKKIEFSDPASPVRCWVLWGLLLAAIVWAIYLISVLRGNAAARTGLAVATVVVAILAYYVLTHC